LHARLYGKDLLWFVLLMKEYTRIRERNLYVPAPPILIRVATCWPTPPSQVREGAIANAAATSAANPSLMTLPLRLFQQFFEIVRVVLAGAQGSLFEESYVEGDGGLDALNAIFAKCPASSIYGLLAG
jgi:hypothetical protein